MKNWQWILVVSVLTFVIARTADIPLFAFLLFIAPLFLVVMTYVSFRYSFRESISLEPVPAKGCESRVAALEKDAADARALGFTKKDSFYLKTVPDSITYVLKHESQPVYMHIYNFGSRKAYEYLTFFERGIELSTGSAVSGGMVPRPPRKLFQVFENIPNGALLVEHLRAVSYIKGVGIKEWDAPYDLLRKDFRKRYLEVGQHVRSFSLWPLRLVFWTVTQRGRVHKRSIEEQGKTGMIQWLRLK